MEQEEEEEEEEEEQEERLGRRPFRRRPVATPAPRDELMACSSSFVASYLPDLYECAALSFLSFSSRIFILYARCINRLMYRRRV